ncbi:MAG: hypothetical protein H6700_02090 [Myxococcales bacterium]|nr:hypothetical protein [Myxococcales bacterium]MCB9521178.1 hypothetical protein [Myxococcales bacterium]MCB9530536.1 hypothetical protein [Myxococcales bacterium]
MTKNAATLATILTLLLAPVAARADVAEPALEETPADPGQLADAGGGESDLELEADAGGDAEEGGRKPIDLPFEINAGADFSVSAGQLNPNLRRVDRGDELALSLSLGISRELAKGISLSVGSGWSTFLTAAGTDDLIFCDPDSDAAAADGDGNCVRRYRGWIDDVSVRLAPGTIFVIPRTGIRVGASLGSTIPLSRYSRVSGLRTFIAPGLSLSRSVGGFSASANVGFNKRWYRYTSVVLDPRELDIIYRTGGNEDLAVNAVAEAGVNTSWSVSTGLNLGYSFTDALSASIGWNFSHAQAYNVFEERDEFTSPNAHAGRVGRQSMTGSFGVDYSFLDHYSVGLSMATSGPPRTSDNKRIRFPFFDTQTGNQSRTSVGLSLGLSY